jgi:hypothetical protein
MILNTQWEKGEKLIPSPIGREARSYSLSHWERVRVRA